MENKIPVYSEDWFKARLGKFTSSTIHNLMVQPKSKEERESGALSKSAEDYVIQKVAERLTGITRQFQNDATVYGVETEAKAMRYYMFVTGHNVTESQFYEYIPNVYGGTPDAEVYINDKLTGILQIKCPYEPKNHIYYSLINDVDTFKSKYKEYYWQVLSDMIVSQAEWCDFISYCPFISGSKQMHVLHIPYNKEDADLLLSKIKKAEELYNTIYNQFVDTNI